jgi:hypothetical protein
MTIDISPQIFQTKNPQISNYIKNHPVVTELLNADGWTDMTKPIVGFRNFAKTPKTAIETSVVTVVESSYEVIPTHFPLQTQIKVRRHVT